jgi:cytosine/adenosine deaminase-related metal-dependent hydrolase
MAMKRLIRAEYLIAEPDRLEAGVIPDGALAIEDGKIVAAGPWSELKDAYGSLESIGGPKGWLALPGLVNAHHHGRGISTLAAGIDDAPLELWLSSFALYPDVDVYWNTLYGVAQMLRSGITTSIQNHSSPGPLSSYRESVERALEAYDDAGVRVAFAMGLFDQQYLANYVPDDVFLSGLSRSLRKKVERVFDVPNLYVDPDEYFALFGDLSSRCGGDGSRCQIILSPIGLQWASNALLERMASVAADYETGIHLHLFETQYQREYIRRRFGVSAPQAMEELGLLGPRTSLAHCVWLTAKEFDTLAQTGTTLITNTSSNLRLGSGVFPLSAPRARHMNVALGLDDLSLLDDKDMFTEMRLLTALHRQPGFAAKWISPYESLRMATVGGARAALFDDRVGKLSPGYRADVILVNLDRVLWPWVSPDVDIVELALARLRSDDVDTVMVDGQVVLEGGEFTKLDPAVIAEKVMVECEPQQVDRAGSLLMDVRSQMHQLFEPWELTGVEPFYQRNSRRLSEEGE